MVPLPCFSCRSLMAASSAACCAHARAGMHACMLSAVAAHARAHACMLACVRACMRASVQERKMPPSSTPHTPWHPCPGSHPPCLGWRASLASPGKPRYPSCWPPAAAAPRLLQLLALAPGGVAGAGGGSGAGPRGGRGSWPRLLLLIGRY